MSIYAYQLLKGLGFSEQRVRRVLPRLAVETLEPNQVICHKGSQQESWIHIVSGMVNAGIPDHDGGITPISIFGPGTWFGEVSILNRQAVVLELVCLSPVRILKVPVHEVVEAFDHEPDFSRHLARLFAWRTQQYAEMLTLMRLGNPSLRVVLGLALFAEALHSSNSHFPTNDLADQLDIPLKQSLLAALCGVSRGVFSECVQQLAATGWLRLNYATLALAQTRVWHRFSSEYRKNRLNRVKPSMQEILSMMGEAAVV